VAPVWLGLRPSGEGVAWWRTGESTAFVESLLPVGVDGDVWVYQEEIKAWVHRRGLSPEAYVVIEWPR
jgi:hypothetical protein